MSFNLHTYDKHIEQCWMEYDTHETELEKSLKCSRVKMTGSVPNLTLTVQMTNMTLQMAGRWWLRIENRIGTAVVKFDLSIESSDPDSSDNLQISSSSEPSHVQAKGEQADSPKLESPQVYVMVSVSSLCVISLFVVIILLCRLRISLTEMKQRYLVRFRNRRRHRQRDQTAIPSVWYRESNVSFMVTNDLYGRSEVKDRRDAFGYSEVRDSCANRASDPPCDVMPARNGSAGSRPLPLPAMPSRVRQQGSKSNLSVKDDDLYQGSTVTGRIDRYGYSELRGISKRPAAAAFITDDDDDVVMGAVGGTLFPGEDPEKEEEGVYAEIEDVTECEETGGAEDPALYVSLSRIQRRKAEQRKLRQKEPEETKQSLYAEIKDGGPLVDNAADTVSLPVAADDNTSPGTPEGPELYVPLTRIRKRKEEQKKRGTAKPIHEMLTLFAPMTTGTEDEGHENGNPQSGEKPETSPAGQKAEKPDGQA